MGQKVRWGLYIGVVVGHRIGRGMRGKKRKILERYAERYAGYGPTFTVEKLEGDGYGVDHETLRRWLIREGLWQKRRRRKAHRQWRARKEHFGELVQMDGSPHHSQGSHPWFGPDGQTACLLNMIDDAQGTVFALLDREETTAIAMRALWGCEPCEGWIERYGIPKALYVDFKNVYITTREPTIEEQLRGECPLTQFGKACKKLGIEILGAHSPQAKAVRRLRAVLRDPTGYIKTAWSRNFSWRVLPISTRPMLS